MLNGFIEMTREDKVNEFRKAGARKNFDDISDEDELATASEMIASCIHEEFREFYDAGIEYEDDPNEDTRAQLCKEWADLQYVVSQAAVFYAIPADAAFNRVHNSNMSKVIGGSIRYREDGKILKPDTYEAPDMKGL